MSSRLSALMGWSFFETLSGEIVVFIVGIVLARLLGAEEYGLCGVLMVFITISQGIIDGGFGSALIQSRQQHTEQDDRNTIFWFNMVISIGFYLLLFCCSDWVAQFYRHQVLSPMLQVLALLIVINAGGLVQRSILVKELKMQQLAIINSVGIIISSILGIWAAYYGAGAWSIIICRLSRTGLVVCGLWVCSSWRPNFSFCWESFRRLWRYASRIISMSFIENVFNNLNPILIGRYFSISDVGIFTRAQSITCVPRNLLQGTFVKFSFPFFSKNQHDLKVVTNYYFAFLWLSCSLLILCMGGLLLLGKPLILLLLTEKWSRCIPILQVLCVLGWVMPIQAIGNALLNGLGHVDALLKLTIFQRIILVVAIAVSIPFGFMALIIATSVAQLINSIMNIAFVAHVLQIRIMSVLRLFFVPLLSIAVACGGCWLLMPWWPHSMYLQILLIPFVVTGIFGLSIWLFSRHRLRRTLRLISAQS